jgi:hypothetical protein
MTPDASHTFLYVECDVPADLTLDEWRRQRAVPRRRGLRRLTRKG